MAPHLETFYYGSDDDWGSHSYTEAPIGTCPECVEAAMKGKLHLVEKIRYSGGMVRVGLMQGLLENMLLQRLEWEG
jgi:hypothetical protein